MNMNRKLISIFLLCVLQLQSANAQDDFVKIDLYIKDHKFIPDVLYLQAGKKIIITLHNQDSTIEEFESVDLKREKIVLGNSAIKIILAPLKVGEYRFFGEFHEETAQGKIVVKE